MFGPLNETSSWPGRSRRQSPRSPARQAQHPTLAGLPAATELQSTFLVGQRNIDPMQGLHQNTAVTVATMAIEDSITHWSKYPILEVSRIPKTIPLNLACWVLGPSGVSTTWFLTTSTSSQSVQFECLNGNRSQETRCIWRLSTNSRTAC